MSDAAPSAPGPAAGSTRLATLRVLAAALCASPVLLLVLVVAVPAHAEVPLWVWLIGPVLLVIAAVATPVVGYPRGTGVLSATSAPSDPEATARASADAFQSSMFVRLAPIEGALLAAAAATIAAGNPAVYLVTLVPGVLLLVRHVWPSERLIRRYQQALELDGHPSYLRQGLRQPVSGR